MSTSSASLCGRFRSAGVLSTLLRSPPRRRALHPLFFSTSLFSLTSSSGSLPRRCSLHPVAVLHLHLVFSTSFSSFPPPLRLLHLLFVEPISSASNPYPPRRTRLLVVEPVSSNPIEPTSGLVESALMSLPSGGLALVIAGLLESPSLAPTRRRWVGFAVVGLDPRLLASARCRRPTVVFDLSVVAFDLAMRPLVLLLVSYLPLLPRRGVVSSSSSSSSCRLSLFLFSLLLLRLMSSPSSFSSCPPLLLPVVSLGFPDGVVVCHRDPPSSSSSSRTSTLPPPHRELIPSLLVVGSR